MVDVEFIRKKHLAERWSIRLVSRQLGLARQTVRKAVMSPEPPRYPQQAAALPNHESLRRGHPGLAGPGPPRPARGLGSSAFSISKNGMSAGIAVLTDRGIVYALTTNLPIAQAEALIRQLMTLS